MGAWERTRTHAVRTLWSQATKQVARSWREVLLTWRGAGGAVAFGHVQLFVGGRGREGDAEDLVGELVRKVSLRVGWPSFGSCCWVVLVWLELGVLELSVWKVSRCERLAWGVACGAGDLGM